MGEQTSFKVGDVVAWADVPDGALVRRVDVMDGVIWHIIRDDGRGSVVGVQDEDRKDGAWYSCAPRNSDYAWEPWGQRNATVTIVALGLSGTESADTLRSLAS